MKLVMKVPFSFYYKILIQVVEYLHQLGGVLLYHY